MATYQDWIAFREAVLSANLMNRTEFFAVVRHSQVRDVEGLPDTAATRALLACQALRLVLPQRVCGHCDTPHKLYFKSGRYKWTGPRYESTGCHMCLGQEYSATSIGFLSQVQQHMWMSKLDCFAMWIFEYSRQQLLRELHPTAHDRVDSWTRSFQQTLSGWYQVQIQSGFEGAIFKKMVTGKPNPTRRPACATKKPSSSASTLKRPSSSSIRKKPSGVKKLHLKSSGSSRIFIADETHLNKRKPNVLAQNGRPQRDQVWLWGAVLQGHLKTHFIFRVLKHHEEAFDGKPRGHKEMLHNLIISWVFEKETFS